MAVLSPCVGSGVPQQQLSCWALHRELLQLLLEGVRDGNPEQAVGRRASNTHTKKGFNCKGDGRQVGGVAVRELWSGECFLPPPIPLLSELLWSS